MTEIKKLAGQTLLEHDALRLGLDDDIIEYRKAMESDIVNKLYDTAYKSMNNDLYRGKDFYIVMLNLADRVLKQPRSIIFARRSCPSPVYKQSVWKFHPGANSLEFMWSLPDALLYYHILRNKHKLINDPETADITKFCILMESGELLEWIKKENGEKVDAVIKITKEH